MGDAKKNILSPSYAGELPDEFVGGKVTVAVEMSTEFKMRLAAWQADPVASMDPETAPKPTLADADAVFHVTGQLVRPSALITDRSKWPSGEAPMGELFRLPYAEYIGRIEDRNPHLRASKVEPSTEEEAKPA